MAEAHDRVTRPNDGNVERYLASVSSAARRVDADAVLTMMRDISGVEPVLWGTSIVGFGRQPYKTADGKERDWFAIGLAPRKAALTLYGLTYYGSNADLLGELGPHSTGKGCLYIKRLADVDHEVLRRLIERAWAANHREAS